MSNSNLVSYTKLSPHNSGKRKYPISRITPHCVVGQLDVVNLGEMFTNCACSANYGIGKDGRVALYVDESQRAWTSSNYDNDQRAVTIECASDKTHPYAMTDTVYQSLVALCVDICRRNGKNKLMWIPDKDTAVHYKPAENEMLITVHRWFANKSCPGNWLYNRLGELAATVTAQLADKPIIYRVQVGAFSNIENAKKYLENVKNAGFPDAFISKA